MRPRLWLVLSLLFATHGASGGESLLEKRVPRFIFHGKNHKGAIAHVKADGPAGIEEAFRSLASHAEVPICIEARAVELVEPPEPVVPIEIDAKNKTVGEILEQMISQDRRYIYRERLGVIEVLPPQAEVDPGDCLNMVIPVFQTEEDWNVVFFQSLRCQIDRVSRQKELLPNPIRAGGCPGGTYVRIASAPRGTIKATFENERVRDILSKLSAMVGNMAWGAGFKGGRPACEDMSLDSYQPRQFYPTDEPGPDTRSEGLPKKCMTCHYHRP